jgi:hypothetical protein
MKSVIRNDMADNKVVAKGNTILIIAVGGQTALTVSVIRERMMKLLKQRKGEVDIIIDLRAVGFPDEGAREEARKFLKILPYRNVAMFGANPFLATIVKVIIKKSLVARERVKMFRTEAAAYKWLAEKVKTPTLDPAPRIDKEA